VRRSLNKGRSVEEIPIIPTQDSIQEILHKVIIAHQQALALLATKPRRPNGRPGFPTSLPQSASKPKCIVDVKLGDQVERKMTIMFSDIRDFTPLSESMTPAENFEFINSYLRPDGSRSSADITALSTNTSATPSWLCSKKVLTKR